MKLLTLPLKAEFMVMELSQVHNLPYLLKHAEVALLLASREDRAHPSIKHHIREAVREASNKVASKGGTHRQTAQWVSLAAKAKLNSGVRMGLINEHVVTASRLTELVVEHVSIGGASPESVASLICQHTQRAVITEEEDKVLAALAKKTMPDPGDWLSRYRLAGIEVVPNEPHLYANTSAMP